MAASSTAERVSRIAIREGFDQVSSAERQNTVPSFESQATQLVVRRRDIEFTDVGPGRVEISITVTNAGLNRSQMAPAIIQAAPFGAFVDWRHLTVLRVPPLDPGESTVLRAEAERVVPLPLGSPDRVSPGRILTALGAVEKPARQSQQLPTSVFDLLTGRETYWAGNLNVFIGGTAVERHVAKALRIVPGRTNAAMFVVGDSGPEWYRFDLVGLGADWEGAIFDPMSARSLARGLCDGERIEPGSWRSLQARSMLLLALRPPAGCTYGSIEVHVTQRSTQKTAVVEFSFDRRASGPGCYVVE